ncbi:OmpA family protein [Bermanella sp. WJH001]|uniref:OmpA family protein n=1 Tax=Bermanella sp. WJH001 TaxID=3048005 RepID=UPI0024BE8269|nr:OmpA family protein [Bermanella sp. WJH001]MDJ1537879.1 OmpA family protein [Bermanella sp. WJH001]
MLTDEEKLGGIKEQEGHWVAVSDLMAGLMMVFLLISIVFMINVELQRKKITDVAILYDHLRTQLYQDLLAEFEPDLKSWGAEIQEDLTFRFNKTELLFAKGDSELNPEFQTILADFFPRYLGIITADKYRNDILEVRIEGHTSSAWLGAISDDDAYIYNMALSQARTRSTLAYLLNLPEVTNEKKWLKTYLTANGLSSAKVVQDNLGNEDDERSRRVEFKVRTDAEGKIASILEDVLP